MTRTFGDLVAVNQLSLEVPHGSSFGFLGPNGAGKTTTIKILTSLLSATSGRAWLNGLEVTEDPKEALASVGSVVETPEFYPFLTPRETLTYLGRLRGMAGDEIATRVSEVLDQVRMSEWIDERIGKFSKGMKQRVAIAQAMLHQPNLLILDEPTLGLDPRGMVEVREIIQQLHKEGYTVFMSSHLLAEVQEVCDQVAIIQRGKLVVSERVTDLSQRESSARLEVLTLEPFSDSQLDTVRPQAGLDGLYRAGPTKLVVDFTGDLVGRAALLERIQRAGIRVASFRAIGGPLESLYMELVEDSR